MNIRVVLHQGKKEDTLHRQERARERSDSVTVKSIASMIIYDTFWHFSRISCTRDKPSQPRRENPRPGGNHRRFQRTESIKKTD